MNRMNRWYLAAVVVLVVGITAALLLRSGDCTLDCPDIQVSPIVGIFAAVGVAFILGVVGFLKSDK
jgi:hypothetical protein